MKQFASSLHLSHGYDYGSWHEWNSYTVEGNIGKSAAVDSVQMWRHQSTGLLAMAYVQLLNINARQEP